MTTLIHMSFFTSLFFHARMMVEKVKRGYFRAGTESGVNSVKGKKKVKIMPARDCFGSRSQ